MFAFDWGVFWAVFVAVGIVANIAVSYLRWVLLFVARNNREVINEHAVVVNEAADRIRESIEKNLYEAEAQKMLLQDISHNTAPLPEIREDIQTVFKEKLDAAYRQLLEDHGLGSLSREDDDR